MTEAKVRQAIADTILGWVGCKMSDGSHKKIIDIYNGYKPLARGYKVKYTDAWCAATVSAVAIVNGCTDIMPTECSCFQMVELYKKLGRWQERDDYKPQIGDLVMYDWDDSGAGDCTGQPDHVGIVTRVDGNSFYVTEGNCSSAVKTRKLSVDGKYIRGFCLPDYAKKAAAISYQKEAKTAVTVSVLKLGAEGAQVKALQALLNGYGHPCGDVDGSFGAKTYSALCNFQRYNGLCPDGSCGPLTWKKLLGA